MGSSLPGTWPGQPRSLPPTPRHEESGRTSRRQRLVRFVESAGLDAIATRTVTVKTLPLMICAVTAVCAVAPGAVGQTAEQRVAACIANNGVRYADSSSATVSQYFSVAAACQAAAQSGSGVEVTVTPAPTREEAPNGPRTEASGAPDTPATEGSTTSRRTSKDGSAGPDSPSRTAGEPASANPGGRKAPRANDAVTAGIVKEALAVREPAGRSLLSPASALTPAGAGLLGAAAVIGAGGFFLRRRRPD
jgi:cobalamin biosynthesis Mg chelatase CobN